MNDDQLSNTGQVLPNSSASDHASQFLLVDLGILKDFRQDLIQQGETRINFYVTVVSLAVVGIGVINQGFPIDVAFLISAFIFSGLIAMGNITFIRMVERSIGIVRYTRRLNRIRRYFLDQDKSLANYMSFPTYDDHPHFKSMGFFSTGGYWFGLPELVAIINSIVISSGISLAVATLGILSVTGSAVSGVGVLLVVLMLHGRYHNKRIGVADENAVVNFPSPMSGNSPRTHSMLDEDG